MEPILSTGRRGAANSIDVEYLPGGHITLWFQDSGQPAARGPELSVPREAEERLLIQYDGLGRRLRVKLDDAVALDLRAWWFPTARDQIRLGENRYGDGRRATRFSGTLRVLGSSVDLSPQCMLVPENVTDIEWDHGVARSGLGPAFVYYGNMAIEKLWMGSLVRFSSSSVRSVIGSSHKGPLVYVFVSGPALDPARDGNPNVVTCE